MRRVLFSLLVETNTVRLDFTRNALNKTQMTFAFDVKKIDPIEKKMLQFDVFFFYLNCEKKIEKKKNPSSTIETQLLLLLWEKNLILFFCLFKVKQKKKTTSRAWTDAFHPKCRKDKKQKGKSGFFSSSFFFSSSSTTDHRILTRYDEKSIEILFQVSDEKNLQGAQEKKNATEMILQMFFSFLFDQKTSRFEQQKIKKEKETWCQWISSFEDQDGNDNDLDKLCQR